MTFEEAKEYLASVGLKGLRLAAPNGEDAGERSFDECQPEGIIKLAQAIKDGKVPRN